MNRQIISLVCCAVLMSSVAGPARAQGTPEEHKAAAFEKVKVATQMVARARAMLAGSPGKGDIVAAVELYANAGKLFEEALAVFKALGPQYVDPKDAEGCEKAMQSCLAAIGQCKSLLNKASAGL